MNQNRLKKMSIEKYKIQMELEKKKRKKKNTIISRPLVFQTFSRLQYS